jgi:peroxiredoxin
LNLPNSAEKLIMKSKRNGREHKEHAHDAGQAVRREVDAFSRKALPPGREAPDFELNATPDQKVDLNYFRGRPVILAFYPADWSPVCGDQLALYNEILPEFNKHGAQLIGISVDGVWCHTAYARDRKLHFPLLADFEPKGEVAREYGVYRAQEGLCERALFVIDREGVIRWSYVSPLGVNPGADGILSALESISGNKEERNWEVARA